MRLRPLLSLLMHAPRSASEVAEALGTGVKRAHYLLTRLETAGVAQVVAWERRRGRPIRRYEVAPRWFIPYEVTGAETLEAFMGGQILPRMSRFVALSSARLLDYAPSWGYWLERGEEASSLRMGDREGSAEPLFHGEEPFLLNIGSAHLSREQAAELKRRLVAVVEEFGALERPRGQTYTLGLLLVRGDVG